MWPLGSRGLRPYWPGHLKKNFFAASLKLRQKNRVSRSPPGKIIFTETALFLYSAFFVNWTSIYFNFPHGPKGKRMLAHNKTNINIKSMA